MRNLNRRGFTLIELLVVIAIISILSATAIAVYKGTANRGNDAKRKEDVKAIATAFEQRYNSISDQYQQIDSSDFTNGGIPIAPGGGNYFYQLSTDSKSFRTCAVLEQANPPSSCSASSSTCYCIESQVNPYGTGGPYAQSTYYTQSTYSYTQSAYYAQSSYYAQSAYYAQSTYYSQSTYNTGNFPSGAVAYWNLDGSGTDTVGGNNSTNFPLTFSGGKINQAITLNGSSDHLDTTNNQSLQLSNGTVSAWVKSTSPGSSYRAIVAKNSAFGLFLDNNVFSTYDWGNNVERSTGISLNDGTWHFVAMSFQGGVTNGTVLYIDGVPRLTTTIAILSQGNVFQIGADTTVQYLNGQVDEVGVWNRVLTGTEITTLYNCGNGISYGGTSSGCPVWSGAAAYWKLDGNMSDSAGSNTGTNNFASFTTGKIGQSDSFNGLSYATMGSSSTLDHQSSLTLSTWIKTTQSLSPGNYASIAGKGFLTGPINGYGLYLDGDHSNKVSFQVRQASGNASVFVSSTSALNDGNWHHVVGVIDDSAQTIALYVDGTLNSTTSSFGIADGISTAYFSLGARDAPGSFAYYFSGQVDEVGVWNRALSATDITGLYNCGFGLIYGATATSPCLPNPIAYWKLDEGSGTTAADYSGNGYNANLSFNTPTWVAGKSGTGLSFSQGTTQSLSAAVNSGPLSTLNDHTLSYWIKINATNDGNWRQILSLAVGGTDRSPGVWLQAGLPQQLYWRFSGDVGFAGLGVDSGGTPFTIGTWYFITVTKSAGTSNYYVNGNPITTSVAPNPQTSGTGTFYVGASAVSNAAGMTMDDVRVYNQALTSAQVVQLYNNGSVLGIESTAQTQNRTNLFDTLSEGLKNIWDFVTSGFSLAK